MSPTIGGAGALVGSLGSLAWVGTGAPAGRIRAFSPADKFGNHVQVGDWAPAGRFGTPAQPGVWTLAGRDVQTLAGSDSLLPLAQHKHWAEPRYCDRRGSRACSGAIYGGLGGNGALVCTGARRTGVCCIHRQVRGMAQVYSKVLVCIAVQAHNIALAHDTVWVHSILEGVHGTLKEVHGMLEVDHDIVEGVHSMSLAGHSSLPHIYS